MKLALLSYEYPPDTGFGGIGTYTWYQARALAKLGHDVHVLAGALASGPVRTSGHDGVTVHRFRRTGGVMRGLAPLGRWRMWWSKNRLENALSMRAGLAALRRDHTFDLIEMPECGAEGLLVNRTAPCPTVVRFHSPAQLIMPYYDVPASDTRLCSMLEREGIRSASALTSCSAFLAGEVKAKMHERRQVAVIPNGIDLQLFDDADPLDFRAMFGLPRDRPMIFFAGRMEYRKGIDICREIAATILARHEVSFVMAGQDLFNIMANDVLPHVNASTLKGSLHYLGKLDLQTVRAGVRSADIFLLPSRWENCPYSCLEAMAAGRAIVSTDQGGMPELIRDGENGLLATNGDAASYIQRIEQLLGDDAMRARLGAAARRSVEATCLDTLVAQRSAEFYAKVIADGRSG